MSDIRTLNLEIDRFEGALAVVVSQQDGAAIDWPMHLLPDDARAGDHLIATIKIDKAATEAAMGEAGRSIKKLQDS